MWRICVLFFVLGAVLAVPEYKGGFSSSKVESSDPHGETFNGNIASSSHIDGNYKGNKGSGPVAVDHNGGNLDAAWEGKKQTAVVDKHHDANMKTSHGDTVVANGKDGKNIPVNVKGSKGSRNVHIVRTSDNDATAVDDATGKKFAAGGLKAGDNVDVGDGTHDYNSKYVRSGANHATQLKAKVIGNVGPSYTANQYRSDPSQEGQLKSGFNPLDTGGPPLTALTPSVTITQDKIKTQSCPEGQYGDAFGKKGFDIHGISAEVDPVSTSGGVKTYQFPTCFIMKASVNIPPNVNVQDVAGQLTAYITPVGNLECEADKQCPDKVTQSRPQGNCFYCNFCDGGGKKGAVFGTQTDVSSNLCTGKSGSVLPLQWKVCPSNSAGKYNVFQKDLLGILKTDLDATIRIFVKSSAQASQCSALQKLTGCQSSDKAWVLMGCRQAVISYSVGGAATRGRTLGSSAFGKK